MFDTESCQTKNLQVQKITNILFVKLAKVVSHREIRFCIQCKYMFLMVEFDLIYLLAIVVNSEQFHSGT